MTITPTRHDPSEPPGIDVTLHALDGPVYGFAAQPHLAALAATTQTVRAHTVSVSLSYTYYRHPMYRDHPSNFVELTPEQNRAIERAESSMLPQWMINQITCIRYPTLWDAVRTTKATPGDAKNALELRLTAHVNDVLRARNPHHVPVRAPRAITAGRLAPSDLLQTTRVMVNHQPHRGRLLDAGPNTTAFGTRIDNRYLTVVYDTRIAPKLRVEFTTQHPQPISTTA